MATTDRGKSTTAPTAGGVMTGATYKTTAGDHIKALPTLQEDHDRGLVSVLVVSTSGNEREGRCKLVRADEFERYTVLAWGGST